MRATAVHTTAESLSRPSSHCVRTICVTSSMIQQLALLICDAGDERRLHSLDCCTPFAKVGFSGPDPMNAGQVSRELLSVERQP